MSDKLTAMTRRPPSHQPRSDLKHKGSGIVGAWKHTVVSSTVLTMRPTAQWCQSSHQENSLPGPLLRQPHHHHHASTNHSRPPPSNPWGAATTNTPVQRGGGVRWRFISFRERAPVLSLYKCLSVSDCHSASLRSQELPTAHSRPAASSTAPHWQPGRHRHRERRGGEKRGEEGVT